MNKNFCITIGREFGSGGREIARKLSERLGVKMYDKLLSSARNPAKFFTEEFSKGGVFNEYKSRCSRSNQEDSG